AARLAQSLLRGADTTRTGFPRQGPCARRRVAPAPARGRSAAHGARHPKKSHRHLLAGAADENVTPTAPTAAPFGFIDEHASAYPIQILCRVLGVSRSGYYAWKRRQSMPESEPTKEARRLLVEITAFHQASHRTYGAPRIHDDLRMAGWRVSRKRVARLMRQAGLRAAQP